MARLRGRRIVVTLVVVVLVVGVGLTAVWALQRQLIYYPDASDVPPAGEVLPGARDVTLETADGLELGAWYLPADAGRDTGMAVLMAPGNGGNRAGRADLARRLGDRGLSVLLVDYRGYGGNPGSPARTGSQRTPMRLYVRWSSSAIRSAARSSWASRWGPAWSRASSSGTVRPGSC